MKIVSEKEKYEPRFCEVFLEGNNNVLLETSLRINDGSCRGCYYTKSGISYLCKTVECKSDDRKDGLNVIFTEVP